MHALGRQTQDLLRGYRPFLKSEDLRLCAMLRKCMRQGSFQNLLNTTLHSTENITPTVYCFPEDLIGESTREETDTNFAAGKSQKTRGDEWTWELENSLERCGDVFVGVGTNKRMPATCT